MNQIILSLLTLTIISCGGEPSKDDKLSLTSSIDTTVIESFNHTETLFEVDSTKNIKTIPAKEKMFSSKNFKELRKQCPGDYKGIGIKLTEYEIKDSSNVYNTHQIPVNKKVVKIEYLNDKLNSIEVDGENYEINDVSFEGTNIDEFTMDVYFSSSALFLNNDEGKLILQITPPDWTGLMMQFRLYYIIDFQKKAFKRIIL